MRRSFLHISAIMCCLAILVSGCSGIFSQQPGVQTPVPSEAGYNSVSLSDYLNEYLQNKGFMGYALIVKNGRTAYEKGFGYANFDKKLPNTDRTRFRIGSITKQFTALSIMMLEERGLLNVKDTIDKYIPDYPEGDKITIHQLLTHTSGIFNYTDLDPKNYVIKKTYEPKEIIDVIKGIKLNFAPGKKFEYSNSNYAILGYIVERVSGMDYGTFLEKNIFRPLGMESSGYDNGNGNIDNIAQGYTGLIYKEKGPPIVTDTLIYSVAYAAGGICSTPGDLLKWDQSLYTEKLVKKETMNKILTSYVDAGYGCGYGYGWYIKKNNNRISQVFHSGLVAGFS